MKKAHFFFMTMMFFLSRPVFADELHGVSPELVQKVANLFVLPMTALPPENSPQQSKVEDGACTPNHCPLKKQVNRAPAIVTTGSPDTGTPVR